MPSARKRSTAGIRKWRMRSCATVKKKMKCDDCIFCKLANGDIPTAKVYEDADVAVILDAGPASRGHTLVLPKEHYAKLAEVPEALAGKLAATAARIGEAQKKALGALGYNIVINTDQAAGQTVFHCHVHVIPRYGNDEIALWIPGEAADSENVAKMIAGAIV